ncbi:Retrovirus-related Pol polyprotein from transposon TNT 1-94 [Senna tora]|uniref:Retrovirus-related Pol polyprotein from transposon TNT 1-94 n=1 Tax=Senna tora TaxID=362788 RepID=A0A834WDI9_9FABA|nr:Retrovirus-related Pol polyprotein from transposon TNT 1-94 [Senna tora]
MDESSRSSAEAASNAEPKLYLQSALSTTIKLTESNFLIWKLHIVATINGYGLQKFLVGKHQKIYLTVDDEKNNKINPEYEHWEKQDQSLASWLIGSMAEEMVTRMVGKSTLQQVWTRLDEFFAEQTKAKERLLKVQLRSTKKGSKSMSEYLLSIKKVIDELVSIGAPISDHEHIECLFDGLTKDYESFVTNISLRRDDYSVTEIEALLLVQETRIEKFKETTETISANVAQTQSSNRFQNQSIRPHNPQFNNNQRGFNPNRGGFRGNTNNFNRGRSCGRTNTPTTWN